MLDKIGQHLRFIGEKVAKGASWIGSKVGGALMKAAPVVAAFNPAMGAGVAAAGGVARGVGALGDMALKGLGGGGVDVGGIRNTMGQIRSDAVAVRDAYRSTRGPGNPLERPS